MRRPILAALLSAAALRAAQAQSPLTQATPLGPDIVVTATRLPTPTLVSRAGTRSSTGGRSR